MSIGINVSKCDKLCELVSEYTMLELLHVIKSRLNSTKFDQNQEDVRMADKMVGMSATIMGKISIRE